MAITLEQLLESRDNRRAMQLSLIEQNPGKTLVVLTVNIPGNIKRTEESLIIGNEGVEILRDRFGVEPTAVRDLETGFEAFLLTDMSEQDAKKLATGIEEQHPLGRLMDIDVFHHDATPVARPEIGHPARRCLICGEDARVCMRRFAHSQTELHNKIRSIVDEFLQRR